jgi:hypothetical protein
LRGLEPGPLQLSATARGFASAGPTIVEVGIGEEVTGVEVVVDRAYTIAGFVVEKGGKRAGIPGVRVGVFSIAQETGAFAIQPTGADGYFEILGVRPGSYMVIAMGGDAMPDFGKPVSVVDRDIDDLLLALEAGATLVGRVDPATTARLSLEVDTKSISFSSMFDVAKAALVRGEAAATGAFELRHVPPGTFTLVARTSDGRVGKLPITVAAADQSGLVVALESRASIAGRVIDEHGRPVAGVQVRASGDVSSMTFNLDAMGSDNALTSADGKFEIVGIAAGRVTLAVYDDHEQLEWADAAHEKEPTMPIEFTVAATDKVRGVTLTVEARDGTIRGVVLGPDRAPVADAWVSARSRYDFRVVDAPPEAQVDDEDENDDYGWGGGGKTVLTGRDGKFAFDELRRGTYAVSAETAKGGARATKSRVKTGESVTLVLEKLRSLSGVVTLGGTPVASYDVQCEGPGGKQRRHVAAADGRYTIDRLPRGKYKCNATADGGAGSGEVKIEAAPARLDIALGAWARIVGVIVDGNGKPMVGIKVAASPEDAPGDAMTQIMTGGGPTTDASGKFEVDKLLPGPTQIMAFDPNASGFSPLLNKNVTTSAGQTLDLGTVTATPETPIAPTPDTSP